jgi:cytochrome c-type biogenesis protein CcmH
VRRFAIAFVIACLSATGPAWAVNPDEQLADPALEARALELGRELRCVVCQNQSIDDSNAELARDLRIVLRERIAAGDTDRQAIDYIVARYGSFVQLRPPMRADTAALWFGPLVALILGGVGAVFYIRSRKPTGPEDLTPEEEAKAERMLNGGGDR